MSKIYSGKHLSHYAQVMLFDPNVEGSIPEWGENESFAVSSSGLCIATANNTEVEVSVYNSAADVTPNFSKIGEHTVDIGSCGFRVGDVTTNSLADVSYQAGSCCIKIYTNNSDSAQVTSVALVID